MKKIFLFISLLLATTNLMAEPIGEKRAREIATEFLSQKMTRANISNLQLKWAGSNINGVTRTSNNTDDSLMYIYNSAESNSFVIVGGDTNADFVLAYSLNNTFDMENMADGAKAILSAWCRQIEDARKNNKPINIARQSTRTNDNILYETALWSQGEPYNRKAPSIDGKRSVTGCVATAMSILCYYYKWPNNGVGTTPEYSYQVKVGETIQTYSVEANQLGHPYEYDKMIACHDSENVNYTEEQADAVATLMKDMGTSVKMAYHPTGSGALTTNLVKALVNNFGYSKSTLLAYGDNYSYEEWANLIRETLRNYGPTYFGGYDPDQGGHAYVVDGYDENNYFRFNFGWGGNSNGYYAIPGQAFYRQQDALLYLAPDRDGTSMHRDNMTIKYNIEYDLPQYFNENRLVNDSIFVQNDGFTTFNGTIKLILCDQYGNWKQELFTKDYSVEIGDYAYIESEKFNVDITSLNLEEGDRLRVYYKGEYSDEWQWALACNGLKVDEPLVMASAEDLAEGLSLIYYKTNGTLYFENKHNLKFAMYYLYNNTYTYLGEAHIPSNKEEFLELASGYTYKLEFSLGSDPYQLILKL